MQRVFIVVPIGAVLIATLLSHAGCSVGDRPQGVLASGVVLYNGQPVEGADVAFSMKGNDHGAFARTDARGRFQLVALETRDGVIAGTYRVKITKMTVESEWHPDWDEGKRPEIVEQPGLPVRYGSYESSGLTAVVAEDGPNEFTFKLTD